MVVPSSPIVRVRDPWFLEHHALVQWRPELRSSPLVPWRRLRPEQRLDSRVLVVTIVAAVAGAAAGVDVPVAVVMTARVAAEKASADLLIKRQCHRAFHER